MPRVRIGSTPTEPTIFSEIHEDGVDGLGCDSDHIDTSRGAKNSKASAMLTPSPSPNTLPKSLPFSLPISLPSAESLQASLRVSLPSVSPSDVSLRLDLPVSLPSHAKQRQGQQGEKKRKHISLNHPSHPRTNPAHIPRPRNAFILFRSWALSSGLLASASSAAHASGTSRVKDKSKGSASRRDSTSNASQTPSGAPLQQNEASREIAKIWKRVDESTRGVFEEMAREEKRRHREMYPGYRYAPKKVQVQQQLEYQSQAQSRSRAVRKGSDDDDEFTGVVKGGSVKRPAKANRGRMSAATKKVLKKKRRRTRAPLTPETTPEPSSPSPSPSPEPELEAVGDDGEDACEDSAIKVELDAGMHVDEDQDASEGEDEEYQIESKSGSNVQTKPKSTETPTRTQPEFTYPSPSSPPASLFSAFRSSRRSSAPHPGGNMGPEAKAGTNANAKVEADLKTNPTFGGKPTRTRTTINEAYVPLLASTTYYAPTFVHVDRTCRIPSTNASANSDLPNDNLQHYPDSNLDDEHASGEYDLDLDFDYSNNHDYSYDYDYHYSGGLTNANAISGSTVRVEEDETGFISVKQEEDEHALILRALKPYAPLWRPSAHPASLSFESSLKVPEAEAAHVGTMMVDYDMF